MSCVVTTRLMAIPALLWSRCAPRLLVSGCTRSTSTLPCASTTRLRPHMLYVNLVVHHEYSSPLSRLQRSTSTTPRIRVPRHVARHVTRLVAPLIVDYFASRRLVVDYFTYAARPGASARCAARRRLLRLAQARRRPLRLRRASGCLGTSRGSSRGSSSTTPCAATSSCGHTSSTSATPCDVTTCLAATLTLLRVLRAPPRHLPVALRRPFILTSFPN
jgi:hypothetical protein